MHFFLFFEFYWVFQESMIISLKTLENWNNSKFSQHNFEKVTFFRTLNFSQNIVVVVTCHREKFNGKVVSELCVSNSRGAKKLGQGQCWYCKCKCITTSNANLNGFSFASSTLGQVAPKLRSPEIRVEPIWLIFL